MTTFRQSSYEGVVGQNISYTAEGADSEWVGTGATAKYVAGAHRGNTCGRYTEYATISTDLSSPSNVHWRAWFKVDGAIDGNRNIAGMQVPVPIAAISVIGGTSKIRIRGASNIKSDESSMSIVPDVWYGFLWHIDMLANTQILGIHNDEGVLLETLSGPAGADIPTEFAEGSMQNIGSYALLFDDTAVGDTPLPLTGVVPPVITGAVFKDGPGLGATSLAPYLWDGSALAPLEVFEYF